MTLCKFELKKVKCMYQYNELLSVVQISRWFKVCLSVFLGKVTPTYDYEIETMENGN